MSFFTCVSKALQIAYRLIYTFQSFIALPLLYSASVCPRHTWDLTVSTISLSWVRRVLEVEATCFWVGLARLGNPHSTYERLREVWAYHLLECC